MSLSIVIVTDVTYCQGRKPAHFKTTLVTQQLSQIDTKNSPQSFPKNNFTSLWSFVGLKSLTIVVIANSFLAAGRCVRHAGLLFEVLHKMIDRPSCHVIIQAVLRWYGPIRSADWNLAACGRGTIISRDINLYLFIDQINI